MALNLLVKQGIGKLGKNKQVVIEPDQWYPQDAWLSAFEEIAKVVGPTSLFDIGQHVPKHAAFPPQVKDVPSGLQSIDVAYHMNHRKQGRAMFDPASGTMVEGIGHYGYQRSANENRATMVCENPYPCDFDRGLISSIAKRFESRATTTHVDSAQCRKRGDRSCTYVVSW